MEVVYALDVETINNQYERYVQGSGDQVDDTIQWTEAEEAYLFHFRQVLDDIPLNNRIWQEGMMDAKEVTETEISALYHKDGLIRLSITGFYQMIESTQAEKLIDQTQATQKLIDYYHTVILTSETVIDKMELNYIGVIEGQNYRLIPAWIFQVVTREQTEPTDLEPAQAYDAYGYHVIHAITGERIVEFGGETD
ncbi:hypothetical protein [Amphibacillus cookii]|uniref:hypothetical protein n=1 Tax=Amphibacillus cookii TaxID=767787 RepID=UPI00195665A7|nr:hypothetical protein [Amphibacillus cookii]MBM7542335.1 hypothetical protein [Amphibacillus cookii]